MEAVLRTLQSFLSDDAYWRPLDSGYHSWSSCEDKPVSANSPWLRQVMTSTGPSRYRYTLTRRAGNERQTRSPPSTFRIPHILHKCKCLANKFGSTAAAIARNVTIGLDVKIRYVRAVTKRDRPLKQVAFKVAMTEKKPFLC
jgi:hypothetical protein